MLELILGIVVFAGGIFAGQSVDPDNKKELRQCSLACGENRLKEYNRNWGKCICVEEK